MSRTVPRPRASSVVVFLGVVAVFALTAVVLAVGTDGQAALTVGDVSVPRAEVDDELRVLGQSEALAEAVGPENVSVGAGSLLAEPATGIVSSIVQELLLRRYLARVGEKVTAADRQSAVGLQEGSAIGAVFPTLPRWYRERYSERLAVFAAFDRVVGSTADDPSVAQRIVAREARRTPVEVEAEYGRFVRRQISVVPYTPPSD